MNKNKSTPKQEKPKSVQVKVTFRLAVYDRLEQVRDITNETPTILFARLVTAELERLTKAAQSSVN